MKKLAVTLLILFLIFSVAIAQGEAPASIGSQQDIHTGIYVYSDLWNEYIEEATGTDVSWEPSRMTVVKSVDASGDAIHILDGIRTHWNTVTRDIYSMQVSLIKTDLPQTAALTRAAAVIVSLAYSLPESDDADMDLYFELLNRITAETEAFMDEMEKGATSHAFTVSGDRADVTFYLLYTGSDIVFSTVQE